MVAINTLHVDLPGPNRAKLPAAYDYQRIWHNPDRKVVGCLDVWEVHGGREIYQIALEQLPGGFRRWTCTCPSAVYRSEPLGRACKHVLGLMPSMIDK
jgi:hypothetical protein